MSEHSEDRFVKGILAIRDGFIAIVDQLNDILKEYAPSEVKFDIKNAFPKDLADLLTFEETADAIVIKPQKFLGTENFAKIAAIVKENDGEYISAGKNSHFKIPKK